MVDVLRDLVGPFTLVGFLFGWLIKDVGIDAVEELADHIRARIRADIAAAPRDSFPGLSHTAEKERER